LSDTYVYQADYYYGLAKISDSMAINLFVRFAKPFFARTENRKNLPFEYDEDNYNDAASAADKLYAGWLPNVPHDLQLNEMRVLVIEFFLRMKSLKIDDLLQTMVGGAPLSADNMFAAQSEGIAPVIADPQTVRQNAVDTARNAAQSLLGDLGADQSLAFAILAFDDQLRRVEQDIQAYLLLTKLPLLADQTVDQRSADELYNDIKQEQTDLDQAFRGLLAMASDQESARDWITTEYQATVDAVLNWEPAAQWVFYAPTLDAAP